MLIAARSKVEVAAGLTGDEQIIKIAVPTLEEGTVVEVVK